MALSFCSNWGSSSGGGTTTASTVHQHLHHQDNTRFSFSQTQPDQLASHFFGLDYNLSLPDTCIDSLFDTNTNNDDYSDDYYITDYYLPNFHTLPSPENINFLSNQTQISPLDHYHEFEPYSYFPKRQKSCENHYDQMDTVPLFFNGYVPLPDVLPTTQVLPPVLQEASVSVPSHGYVGGSTNTSMKKNTSGVLSAQSIAARERRRKITEKTQELGKLIPGGNKMNTAEMFHSASNYVKFLQAQVSLLQFMGFIQVLGLYFYLFLSELLF